MKLSQVPKQIDKQITAQEKWITSQYRVALKETRSKLGLIYEKYAVDGKLSYADMAKYNRLTALEDELTKVAGSTTSVVNSRLSRLPSDVYKETYLMSAYGIDPAKASLAVIPKKAVESVASNPLDKIARNTLAQTTREGIRRSLVQGVMQGQSYPDMAKSLKKVYEVSAKKALVIARTEGQRAMAEGQRDIMDKAQSMGIKIRLFWDAYLDSRTRDNHAFMNGREAEEHNGELMFYYEPTGQWVTGPMDSSLPASEIVNCRCSARQELADEPVGQGQTMSYEEWKRGK